MLQHNISNFPMFERNTRIRTWIFAFVLDYSLFWSLWDNIWCYNIQKRVCVLSSCPQFDSYEFRMWTFKWSGVIGSYEFESHLDQMKCEKWSVLVKLQILYLIWYNLFQLNWNFTHKAWFNYYYRYCFIFSIKSDHSINNVLITI